MSVKKETAQLQSADSADLESSGSQVQSPPEFSLTSSSEGPSEEAAQESNPLEVEKGQVTFDAEGNDIPESRYFTRVIHWPGTDESGVTLGRGYDMGYRSEDEVLADMLAAGVPEAKANLIAGAAGKRGDAASAFVRDNKTAIGEITHEQQKSLFETIYVEYEERAKGRATEFGSYAQRDSDKPHMMTGEAYDEIHPVIKELLVDFTYRGDFRSTGHAAYSKVNPILKEDISDVEKMRKLKTLLINYRDGLRDGHFMITRTNARIALLDDGIASAIAAEQANNPGETNISGPH